MKDGVKLEKIFEGKTKNVFAQGTEQILLQFKDDITGENGVPDPGGNKVVGQIAGKGNVSLQMSTYFFELLQKSDIPTHYVSSDLTKNTMLVKKAETFGAGLEFICRLRAAGSFVRRYGQYVEEGQSLDYLVEITIKDDQRGDPLINEESIVQLNLMTDSELKRAKSLTQKVTELIANVYVHQGLELVDLKLEFGRINGQIAVIDELSGDNMRVRREGKLLGPKELCAFVRGEF